MVRYKDAWSDCSNSASVIKWFIAVWKPSWFYHSISREVIKWTKSHSTFTVSSVHLVRFSKIRELKCPGFSKIDNPITRLVQYSNPHCTTFLLVSICNVFSVKKTFSYKRAVDKDIKAGTMNTEHFCFWFSDVLNTGQKCLKRKKPIF
jgi:hypothetical protein